MQTHTLPRTAPIALWRVAEAFLHVLYNLFGAPEDVAFRHTLTREPYRLMLSWLRVGEALMRRLIAIEAAAFPKPNTPPRLWPKRTRTRREIGFDDDEPEAWRVTFRCLLGPTPFSRHQSKPTKKTPRRSKPKRPYGAPATSPARTSANRQLASAPSKRISREDRWSFENFAPPSFHSVWPLAERYEALIRVFNNPAPYARRLAARLYALPHRLRELLAAPPAYDTRVERAAEITQAAAHAWRPPDSS
jgi:hypothetical protein